ncbi:MAG: hypothetical protein RLP44_20345 [Aggregatilineales bacterium]
MTKRQITYSLFAQTILLLLLYLAVYLLGAVKFLGDDPLALSLPYQQVNGLANVLLNLVILTGLIASGMVTLNSGNDATENMPLTYVFYGWTALLIVSVLLGVLDLLAGRFMFELPVWALVVMLAFLIGFVVLIGRDVTTWTSVPIVWTAGMTITILAFALGLFSSGDFVRDARLATVALGLRFNVGYILSALALIFWLMRRFSNVREAWAESGLYNLAGMLALAGVLVTLGSLHILSDDALVRTIGNISAIFTPIVYLIFAAHSYRALSDRNSSNTLAAHWVALTVILWVLGMAVMGALMSIADVNQWVQGTRLTDLRLSLITFGVIAVILGMINQSVSDFREESRRITGLMPFWMVAFGIIGGGVALFGAGIVQVYLERILTVGYLETQTYMIPLYVFWVLGLMIVSFGLIFYALGFWARRPVNIGE